MSEEENRHDWSCVDCGTQNCKYKDRTYPDFCLTTSLDAEDDAWAMNKYEEGRNHDIWWQVLRWNTKVIASGRECRRL